VRAAVQTVRYRVNINTLEKEPGQALGLNDIGAVVIESQKPLFCDPYRRNRATGSFILIDPMTNATVAAGMITGREPVAGATGGAPVREGGVTRMEQQARAGHRAVTVWLETAETAHQLERVLFDADCRVHSVPAGPHAAAVARALNDAGVIALVYGSSEGGLRDQTRESAGGENFIQQEAGETAETVYRRLAEEGFISGAPRAN
jgi:bifunctional enzyme CysN/CysC/sulfate adenylyltransferase subunit 1